MLEERNESQADSLDLVTKRIGNEKGEDGYLRTWLARAIEQGRDSRLSPWGLTAPDIIEYLPVERIVPKVSSWEELRSEHAAARAAQKGAKDFEQWLGERYRVRFNEDTLHAYAEGVPVPEEFERLMRFLEATATRFWAE